MRPDENLLVYLASGFVDFRKGINGLSVLVEQRLNLNPFSEYLFVFCNKRRDKIKILYWEQNGFCLWQKRLEKDRFFWPKRQTNSSVAISARQLNWLLDGYDISRLNAHKKLEYSSVL